jgi:hypothetical protein
LSRETVDAGFAVAFPLIVMMLPEEKHRFTVRAAFAAGSAIQSQQI